LNSIGATVVLPALILFCRIGACLMLMPGFSSPRIPVNVRLFLCLAVTLALTPFLGPPLEKIVTGIPLLGLARLIISELMIGGMIGLMGRVFFAALETLGMAIAMQIGLANGLGAPIDENEPLPSVATLLTFFATTLLFITDQHWEVLRGLVASYRALPVAAGFGAQFGLIQVADCFSKAFFLALRIASPFILFALIVNLAIGLLNKLTPQVQVYFVSAPFVVAGGLFLLYFTFRQIMDLFMAGFTAWLRHG